MKNINEIIIRLRTNIQWVRCNVSERGCVYGCECVCKRIQAEKREKKIYEEMKQITKYTKHSTKYSFSSSTVAFYFVLRLCQKQSTQRERKLIKKIKIKMKIFIIIAIISYNII